MRAALLLALIAVSTPIFPPMPPADPPARSCSQATVTAYWRQDPAMNARTYDGTPILTDEPIAAGSWNYPLGSRVEVEGYGVVRIADRGYLEANHVDLAVWDYREAVEIGRSVRRVCVEPE